MDAGMDGLVLHDLASTILESDNPAEAIETALQAIEHERGTGHDAALQEDVQAVYQAARQRLGDLQEEAAENILRNLHGYEDHEITQSRAGLTARRESAPSPEMGQEAPGLPTSGIEHLDLSEAGDNPSAAGRMMENIKNTPAWPVVVSDGKKLLEPRMKDGKLVEYSTGRHHIMERHGHQLAEMGYTNADDYVRHILNNATEVRIDEQSGSYFVVLRGKKNNSKAKHDAAVLELKKEDGYYLVKTAAPFKTGYLGKKTLLQEERRSTPSDHNGHGHPLWTDNGHMPDAHYPRATVGAEKASAPDNGNPPPRSQDKSISEAQAQAARIDQQLAVLGESQIEPEALAGIRQEQAMSDGNADALASAATCLTRKAP